MAVFARVVDKGAFRAAAKELGLAPSRVSQTVSDLEQYLGVTLFYRSTRKLALTSEGHQFYTHVVDMIRSAETGLNTLNALSQNPIGTLKITLPAFLESSPLSSALADFAKQHSEVSLSLRYTDHIVDMLSEGLDLRIRAGVSGIDDSSMMSRKLGEIKRLLVASKVYVDTHPTPQHPSELKNWDWIRFQMRSNVIEFISPSNEVVNISESARISVNSANALRHFVNQNAGVTILPENLAEDGLQSGELVHLLPEWGVKPLECYAVWPDKSRRENLTMLLVRHLVEKGL
ncbi:MAG: LysR family transcriptional regulator [Cellvibrionaceae bacterium]